MNKKISLLVLIILLAGRLFAQTSNSDLANIQEEADARRVAWNKAFDDGVNNKSLATLPSLRKSAEEYIEQQLSFLGRLYASGDGRELITAVKNYLQIQKQFVKNVMIPTETLDPSDQEAVNKTNQHIADFTLKEKTFLIDINNALRTSPEPAGQVDQEMNQDEPEQPLSEEERKKKEEAKPHRKGKLPHEMGDSDKKSKKEETTEEE